MQIKKSGKFIFGAELTAAEKKALNMEIQRQLVEYNRQNTNEIDAAVLWVLHEQFGFGPVRLRRFYDAFNPTLKSLSERYQMTDDGDDIWLCQYKLKNYGIDIDEWNKKEEPK